MRSWCVKAVQSLMITAQNVYKCVHILNNIGTVTLSSLRIIKACQQNSNWRNLIKDGKARLVALPVVETKVVSSVNKLVKIYVWVLEDLLFYHSIIPHVVCMCSEPPCDIAASFQFLCGTSMTQSCSCNFSVYFYIRAYNSDTYATHISLFQHKTWSMI